VAQPLSSQGRQARELVDLSLWNPETSRILADLSLWMEAAITSFAATNAADCSLMGLTAGSPSSRRLGVRFFRTGFSSSGIGWSLALESEMGRLWQVCCEWCHVKWIFWIDTILHMTINRRWFRTVQKLPHEKDKEARKIKSFFNA
jgi:hypothetical protein